MQHPERTRRRRILAACALLYLAIYAVLSSQGNYVRENHGGNDNRETWYAAHCGGPYLAFSGRQRGALNVPGLFFLPLVVVDRIAVHPTRHLT